MRDLVRELAGHPFFGCVSFSNSRYTHDLVAAQFVRLEMEGGPTNVKNRDLNNMYEEGRDIAPDSDTPKGVQRVLDLLTSVFPDKTPELTRYNAISLYCVAAELLQAYVRSEFEPLLHDWFVYFEARRSEQEGLSEDEADPEWVQYRRRSVTAQMRRTRFSGAPTSCWETSCLRIPTFASKTSAVRSRLSSAWRSTDETAGFVS